MSIVHDGWSDKLDLSGTRMLDLDDEPPCFDLRVIKCLGDVVDGTEWHSVNYNETSESYQVLRVLTQVRRIPLSNDPSGVP